MSKLTFWIGILGTCMVTAAFTVMTHAPIEWSITFGFGIGLMYGALSSGRRQ